jgi:hypothetical protein
MEAAFFVKDALKRIEPGIGADEAGFLGVFDSHCDLIHSVAVKICNALELSRPGACATERTAKPESIGSVPHRRFTSVQTGTGGLRYP